MPDGSYKWLGVGSARARGESFLVGTGMGGLHAHGRRHTRRLTDHGGKRPK